MARLREFEFSAATLGEKKANVKHQVVFVLLSLLCPGTSGNDIHVNMLPQRESLPAVTAAAVVAIVFSVVGVLSALLVEFTLIFVPTVEAPVGRTPMPAFAKTMSQVVWIFLLAVAVFGIFVGVGVLRRRNWARISMLIWGGLMAFFSAVSIPFLFIVLKSLPAALSQDADAVPMMSFMKWFFAFFYGIPLSVGIWWLILFTRKRVAAAFTIPSDSFATPSALDPSGFPQFASPMEPPRKPKPSCPLLIAIVAVFFIFSAVCMCLMAIVPMPVSMPLFLFGHVFVGAAPKIFLGVLGIVTGVAGFGLLKLKPWALYAELVLQSVLLVNGILTILSPNFQPVMHEAMEKMYLQNPAFPGGNPFITGSFFRSVMIYSMVFVVAVIAILLFQRSRFLEAAAEAAKV